MSDDGKMPEIGGRRPIPIMMERVPILFLLSVGGIFVAFRRASSEHRFLCLFLFLQLVPLVWTNLSNPTARVPYGSTLPFELFLAALFVDWLSANPRVRSWLTSRFENRFLQRKEGRGGGSVGGW